MSHIIPRTLVLNYNTQEFTQIILDEQTHGSSALYFEHNNRIKSVHLLNEKKIHLKIKNQQKCKKPTDKSEVR